MSFDQMILEGMLVCTRCQSRLLRRDDSLVCTNADCRTQFAIRDEIPNMLLDDAQTLAAGDWSRLVDVNDSGASA